MVQDNNYMYVYVIESKFFWNRKCSFTDKFCMDCRSTVFNCMYCRTKIHKIASYVCT